ncbi:sugar phosphate isomerase/epimerase [Hoyosella altamirensis]|uniref:Sugar phosphate isomerase/epimerase n=2 Tax=Hoyosella altamirensis TaxID=616997 RepID=A0A839RMF4_9ACTN|nr:sugar phosphate isomerase/epimerase [Hoyosella altamirensis]
MTYGMRGTPRNIRVGLSTASVYPQNTEAAFQYAAELGYDGVEVMVWAEQISQDTGTIAELSKRYGVPILSIHAPCLLISQRVWGSDPATKLDRSAQMAADLGADTVVVHPPFRWQRKYVDGFADQVMGLEASTGVNIAVENMFPMRADRLFGKRTKSAERMRVRGGPGRAVSAFAPSYDPTDVDHPHFTLDLSHTATAGMDAIELADRMGERLVHVHLADGRGASVDEHLLPGHGTQPCAEICQRLAEQNFEGQVVLEISTKHARTTGERSMMLGEALQFARSHLGVSAGDASQP